MGFEVQIDPEHRECSFSLPAAGVQLPQRINRPLTGDWQWESASGELARGRAFAYEQREAGSSVLSAGACCADGQ